MTCELFGSSVAAGRRVDVVDPSLSLFTATTITRFLEQKCLFDIFGGARQVPVQKYFMVRGRIIHLTSIWDFYFKSLWSFGSMVV